MGKPGKCVACGKKFQTKNKGYKRFSLKSQLGPSFGVDVAAALSQAVPEMIVKFPDEGHVCDSCFRLLRTTLRQREQLLKTEIEWEMRLRSGPQGKNMPKSKVRGKTRKNESRTSKRKLEEVQNIMNNPQDSNSRSERRRKRMKLEPTVAVLCKNGGHKNYMKKSIAYLIQYRYHKAFSIIIAESKRAKKAFIGVMEKEIRKEAFYFCKTAEKLSQETAIKNFSWKKELKKMELEMPTFYSACHAAMDTRKGTVMVPDSRTRYCSRHLGCTADIGDSSKSFLFGRLSLLSGPVSRFLVAHLGDILPFYLPCFHLLQRDYIGSNGIPCVEEIPDEKLPLFPFHKFLFNDPDPADSTLKTNGTLPSVRQNLGRENLP